MLKVVLLQLAQIFGFSQVKFLFPKVSLNNKLKPDIRFLCHRCSLKTENTSILSNFSAFTAKTYVRVIFEQV